MSLRRSIVNLSRRSPASLPTARQALPSAAIAAARALSTRTRPTASPSVSTSPSVFALQKRWSSGGGLGSDEIERRVLEVLQSFEKAEPGKITPTASFAGDLGLDSLDAVEVVLAIEEEFSIEIPDEEADKITTVAEAISYIGRTPEAQ